MKQKIIIKNGIVLNSDSISEKRWIEIVKGEITKLGLDENIPEEPGVEFIDAEGGFIAPGFIDTHTHGGFGHDFAEISLDSFLDVLSSLPKFGTTSILATIGSTSYENLHHSIKLAKENLGKINKSGTKFLGFHVEGPFLNIKKKGAQSPEFITPPDMEKIREVVEYSEGLIKIVTLAPELLKAIQLIEYLRENEIVVSVGHSDADGDTTFKAFDAGAVRVTHLYNCMSPLHHRTLGVTGAALYRNDVYTELVMDGFHVHPKVARLTYLLKGPEKLVLVTDATHIVGLPEGEYIRPGNRKVVYKDGAVRQPAGNLAGSVLSMDRAFKNSIEFLEIDPFIAAQLTSTNAAKSIGNENIGSIKEGMKADLVIMNKGFSVMKTIIDGKIEYSK